MRSTAMTDNDVDCATDDLGDDIRALRDCVVDDDSERRDRDQSPQAFYERSIERPDVRGILKRLAAG